MSDIYLADLTSLPCIQGSPALYSIDITSLPCIQGSPPLVPTATAHWCAQDPYGLGSADVDLFYISLPELPLSVGQASTGLTQLRSQRQGRMG